MKKYIPNALTLLNLFCGCIAVILVINDNFVNAALFVFLGIFFDFFDGFAARKLQVQSDLGIQLDSLADMVTSGLVPGLAMFKLLALSDLSWEGSKVIPYWGLAITLASAYRLAKFNIDEDQKTYFKGLPTPANALLIMSLLLILEFQNSDLINNLVLNQWFLMVFTMLSCWLLNSNIKLFALKFDTYGFKPNATRYIFILLSAVFIIVLHYVAIPLIIIMYISMSVLNNVTSK